MAAGGPGDHPLSDILNFDLEVYNERCDQLVNEISKFVSRETLYEMFNWIDNFSANKSEIKELEQQLSDKLKELKNIATENGWEIE